MSTIPARVLLTFCLGCMSSPSSPRARSALRIDSHHMLSGLEGHKNEFEPLDADNFAG